MVSTKIKPENRHRRLRMAMRVFKEPVLKGMAPYSDKEVLRAARVIMDKAVRRGAIPNPLLEQGMEIKSKLSPNAEPAANANT